MEYVTVPKRTLHGVASEQRAPMVNRLGFVTETAKSPSWEAVLAPDPPDPPPLPELKPPDPFTTQRPLCGCRNDTATS